MSATALALFAAALVAPAAGADPLQPYGQNDYGDGGFRNILPAGECQNVDATEIGAFELSGAIPAHCDDQRKMYENLLYATPGLQAGQVGDYFKDGGFGAKPGDVERTYSPRPGVTIVRDQFNVPHIYGATRADAIYGAGYAGAEDRLFFMDVLRHAGRGQLSGFAGGSNKGMDAEVWSNSPYTEADLQRQIDLAPQLYGQQGAGLVDDLNSYVAGINQYISEADLDPTKLPGEYLAIGKVLLPWKPTDVIATAALIGGVLGKGGGGELGNAAVYQAARSRFGPDAGVKIWQDFREANDAEAPTTVRGKSFPYQDRVNIDPSSVALPDPGSVFPINGGGTPSPGGLLGGLFGVGGFSFPSSTSNALLVSGAHTQSGRPLTVFGPQTGYFAPEILMEEDLHAPDFDARGAAFPGVNLYVLLGRGQDFAWSATSAGQDIIDTFAEKLCEPNGSAPTVDSMNYLWKGQCRPIETLERVNVITPNAGDPSPPEVYRLEAQRTVHGVISERGTVDGQPVAFAKLRSTYFHEADSARAFGDFNTPSKVNDVQSFQRAAYNVNFTFNWFYTDNRDIGYFNSGDNPVRAEGTDPEFPTWGTGQWDWQNWNPDLNIARYTPFAEHPQVVNQDFLTSWNNKPAPGYRAAEDQYGYGPTYRSQSLDDQIKARIDGGRKIDLPGLIDAMEVAGTTDLRGTQALPWMLEAIRRAPGGVPGDLQQVVAELQAWADQGGHRLDHDHNGHYDDAGAVQLMDAWWTRALEAIYRPQLGDPLFDAVHAQLQFYDPPSLHLGSAFDAGWEGYVQKDLRSLLGEPVVDPYSRPYCGAGDLAACRDALVSSLRAAIAVPATQLYPGSGGCLDGGPGGDAQMCDDAIQFRTVGAVAINDMAWVNRPTFQQAVELFRHRQRAGGGGSGGGGSGGGGGPGSGDCANPLTGTRRADLLNGSGRGDNLRGKRGNDKIRGNAGNDCLIGGGGRDSLGGGPGIDRYSGGRGRDRIRAVDGVAESVNCDKGRDFAAIDAIDVAVGCEKIRRR